MNSAKGRGFNTGASGVRVLVQLGDARAWRTRPLHVQKRAHTPAKARACSEAQGTASYGLYDGRRRSKRWGRGS